MLPFIHCHSGCYLVVYPKVDRQIMTNHHKQVSSYNTYNRDYFQAPQCFIQQFPAAKQEYLQ